MMLRNVPCVLGTVTLNSDTRVWLMGGEPRAKTADKKDPLNTTRTIDVRLVIISWHGNIPQIVAEQCKRRDACGMNVWEPADLPLPLILAALTTTCMTLESPA